MATNHAAATNETKQRKAKNTEFHHIVFFLASDSFAWWLDHIAIARWLHHCSTLDQRTGARSMLLINHCAHRTESDASWRWRAACQSPNRFEVQWSKQCGNSESDGYNMRFCVRLCFHRSLCNNDRWPTLAASLSHRQSMRQPSSSPYYNIP